jgi:hypothetical protein
VCVCAYVCVFGISAMLIFHAIYLFYFLKLIDMYFSLNFCLGLVYG